MNDQDWDKAVESRAFDAGMSFAYFEITKLAQATIPEGEAVSFLDALLKHVKKFAQE
jgi:hypothetical protein